MNPRIIIGGGGTAGHLYPGLAVSTKLKDRVPTLQVTFVGSGREVEKAVMCHHHLAYIPLRIEGLKGRGLRVIRSLFLLPWALLKSWVILKRLTPGLVIGVGGYSSGPLLLLASCRRIPTLILEQNLRPGFTNRLLVSRVRKAVVAFEASLPYFKGKGVFIGNPVREEFYHLKPKTRNAALTLLVFGGSQGSHFLNRAMVSSLSLLAERKANLRIFHQTGPREHDWVKTHYADVGFQEVVVEPYFHDMAHYFERADLVVSRAGASTIAELIAARKASLLIPFAEAADNHQVLNARELEKAGGAEVILEQEFTPQGFVDKIMAFIFDKDRLDRMEKNLAPLKKEGITEKISDLCLELMTAPI